MFIYFVKYIQREKGLLPFGVFVGKENHKENDTQIAFNSFVPDGRKSLPVLSQIYLVIWAHFY